MNKNYYGYEVSAEGQLHNKVDYRTLAKVVDSMVLCNNIESRLYDTLEIEQGEMQWFEDDNGNIIDEDEHDEENGFNEIYVDVFQWYIITDNGAEFLKSHTDELVFFDNELDVYVWGITHYGTSWDYVLTDIILNEKEV